MTSPNVQADHCEIWAPTQHPQAAQQVAASICGIPTTAVTVHVPFLGGGFGRRIEMDFIQEAVQLSKAIAAPVKIVWTRDDDFLHDFYRPASYQQLSATLSADGQPQSWTHLIATLDAERDTHTPQPATDGADIPYAIPTQHIRGSQVSSPVPAGIWRSSNYGNTLFATESFLDEIAAAHGKDPYQFRLQLLQNAPRLQGVLRLAASKAGWGKPLLAGWGRGIAVYSYFSATAVAQVIDVFVAPDATLQVKRVVCAVDCGLVVNPVIAQSQIEGGIVFGLSAALKGNITIAQGQIEQQSFRDYPLLRMREMPTIEVYFVPSTSDPTGIGELGTPLVAPAVGNAIFAATGKRIRRLPISTTDLR